MQFNLCTDFLYWEFCHGQPAQDSGCGPPVADSRMDALSDFWFSLYFREKRRAALIHSGSSSESEALLWQQN
jgi:hypothetical protein